MPPQDVNGFPANSATSVPSLHEKLRYFMGRTFQRGRADRKRLPACHCGYPKPPHTTAVSHRANVTKLTTSPALAHLPARSMNIATRPATKATGGTKTTEIPPRDPSSVPHPNPGRHSTEATKYAHGTNVKAKLILPIVFPFIPPGPFPAVLRRALRSRHRTVAIVLNRPVVSRPGT